jgi:hypothetical protein
VHDVALAADACANGRYANKKHTKKAKMTETHKIV